MASGCLSKLNHLALFRDISSKFSPVEAAEVVKLSKRIYGEQFGGLQNEDLLSCLNLLFKFGYVSNQKLTLIRDFAALKSKNEEEIKKIIDNYIQDNLLQVKSDKQMQGRDNDITKITGRLKDGRPSIVNLHGAGGVGKTTLAKEICAKWLGKSHIFDLREAKDMRAVYLKVMNMLDLAVPVGHIDPSSVVEKTLEQAFMKSEGLPVLFLLDNADQFTLGQGKEGKNLKTAFMQFLGKLTRYDEMRKTRELRILLTSRTSVKEASKVEDYELQPLKDTFSKSILLSNKTVDINEEQLKKFSLACSGKPLLLQGLRAILEQGRKSPSALLNELEKRVHSPKKKEETPVKSKVDEDAKEKAFDFEDEGVGSGEISVIHEMFNTLPSDSLKESAVSISLFCGPFSASTAAVILGISLPEAVAQLEGLETSAIISVENQEAKELMYDIHPLLKKHAESIKNDKQFVKSYNEAKKRFYDHFMSQMKEIGGFIDADFVKAFTKFTRDDANYKFAIDIFLEQEFFSVPSEDHENMLIVSLINAMLPSEKRRELFKSWASVCRVDTEAGSLFHAHLKCWEAMHVLDLDGHKEASDVLQEALHSLEKVQDKTATNFKLTKGLYSYTEGEIYCKAKDFKKALQSLEVCLYYIEELPEVHIQLARCYNAMGNCYYHGLEDYTKALEFYSKALKKIEEISGSSEYHYELPVFKNQIATVYEAQENYPEAIKYYKEAIRLLEELKISGGPEEAIFQRNLANAYMHFHKFEEAEEPAERAFEIRQKHLGNHPRTVRSIFQRGVIQNSISEESEKALDLFKKAWEMEKSLQPGNHSVVWKLIIEHIIYFIKDDIEKKKFEKEALAFCQRFWKEEKEISTFSFNESTKEIIDTLMEFLYKDGERDKSTIYEYEKEELWFYDGFQDSTEQDFWRDFDAETENRKLNAMICDRTKLIDKILGLCNRLDQHEMRTKYQRMKLTIYRKVLFKPNFVGEKGNEKETMKNAVEQLYRDLGEKERIPEFLESLLSSWIDYWEQTGGGADASEVSSLARERTIRGILELCKDLNKEKQYLQFGREALTFFEDLWREKIEKMNARMIKKFLREIKDLASSVRDYERERLYQDVYQTFLNTGEKPGTLRYQESEVLKEEEQEDKEGESVSEEEEIEISLEDETVEPVEEEEEEEVVLTSEGENDVAAEDENEFLGDFSGTNCESIVLYSGVVTSEGIHLDLYRGGVHLTFPPGSVTESTTIMVHRWKYGACLPTLGEHEAVVSNVIKISAKEEVEALEFEDKVKLALSHSAADLEGYELVIKKLLDAETNEWEEVDGCENIRGISDIEDNYPTTDKVPHFLFPVVQAGILECSTYAVVSRLKVSPTYTITVNGGTFGHPDYPQVAITVPKEAVGTKTELPLQLKVQEVPQDEFLDVDLFAGPILRIFGSPKAEFLKPVTIQLPVCLREKNMTIPNPSMCRVRIFFLRSETESKDWIEISSDLENPATYDGKVVKFQVRRFSGYACFLDWCRDDLRTKTGDIIQYLWSIVQTQPQKPSFFAYFNPKKRLNYEDILHLICCPVHLRRDVKEEIERDIGKQGSLSEVSSKRMMIPERDETFVSVSGGINTLKDMEVCCLSFDGKSATRDELCVVVIDEKVYAEVEFHSTPETTGKKPLNTLRLRWSTLSIDDQIYFSCHVMCSIRYVLVPAHKMVIIVLQSSFMAFL
ncbi:uncharacterized protein [Acropora muricata]|uniref:uncharacterized protein isoform X2 n=1 Tax=Acropora muricata TaxID=159855 RepID=UPI0034E45314